MLWWIDYFCIVLSKFYFLGKTRLEFLSYITLDSQLNLHIYNCINLIFYGRDNAISTLLINVTMCLYLIGRIKELHIKNYAKIVPFVVFLTRAMLWYFCLFLLFVPEPKKKTKLCIYVIGLIIKTKETKLKI